MRLFILTTCIVLSMINCTSTQQVGNTNSTSDTLTIDVAEEVTANYIKTSFAQFKPSDIKRSNKSKNQYQVTFDYVDKKELAKRLEADENILKVYRSNNKANVTSSTSNKSSKVKINKNN